MNRMKRILIGVMVFAACVLLVQCRKPVFPNFDGGGNADFPDALTVTTGDNSKGVFNTVDGKLRYKWENGDVLFVYSGKVEGDNFVGSKFLGKLDLIEGKNTYIGTFYGGTKKPAEGDTHLRFIHYGTSVTANDDGTASVSFASQTGTLAEISQKVVAVGEVEINKSGIYNECRLKPQFSVAMLKFTDFPSPDIVTGVTVGDITVSGIAANQITVSNTGDVSFTVSSTKDGPTMVLDNAVGTATAPVKYYAVFMPENGKREHVFSSSVSGTDLSGTKSFKMSFQFTANGYYVGSYTGGTCKPFECKGTWEGGVLPGKFSVSKTVKVQFSQGNLVYDNTKFYFHENQYDRCFSASGDVTSYYSENGKFDLFGWGTGSLTAVSGKYAQPWITTATGSKYGPTYISTGSSTDEKYMLNNGSAGGTNYPTYDWGHNSGIIGTGWYSISNADYKYMIGYWNDAGVEDGDVRGGCRFARANVNGVFGLILLPDGWTKATDASNPLYLKAVNDRDATDISSLTADKWKVFELSGCVFLPGCGYRNDQVEISNASFNKCYYWSRSSSSEGGGDARSLTVNAKVITQVSTERYKGLSVRLIRRAN